MKKRQKHKAVLEPEETKGFEIIFPDKPDAKVVFITDEAKLAAPDYRGVYRRKPLSCAEIRDYARLAKYGSDEMKELTKHKLWKKPQPSRRKNG